MAKIDIANVEVEIVEAIIQTERKRIRAILDMYVADDFRNFAEYLEKIDQPKKLYRVQRKFTAWHEVRVMAYSEVEAKLEAQVLLREGAGEEAENSWEWLNDYWIEAQDES